MIPPSRARPMSINVFAAAFLTGAVVTMLDGLQDIATLQRIFAANVPGIEWSRDAVIVALSARLSIALIPVAMVWLSAVRFARWMVTVLALGKLLNVPEGIGLIAAGNAIDKAWLTALVLALGAVAMLFTPASNRWFARQHDAEEDGPAVFE